MPQDTLTSDLAESPTALARLRSLRAQNREWHVLEIESMHRLYVWSSTQVRVITNYPHDWQRLGDAELFALSAPYTGDWH